MISLKVDRNEMQAIGLESYDNAYYPYGTEIELDEAILKRLGIRQLPAVGEEMKLQCKAVVTKARMSTDGQKGITLQLTHIEFDDDDDDDGLTRSGKGAMSAVAKKLGRM